VVKVVATGTALFAGAAESAVRAGGARLLYWRAGTGGVPPGWPRGSSKGSRGNQSHCGLQPSPRAAARPKGWCWSSSCGRGRVRPRWGRSWR
jgi:hypothetical protein